MTKATTETNLIPSCPLCNCAGRAAFDKDEFKHAECDECGTWYVYPTPEPEALVSWYQNARSDKNSSLCWESSQQHVQGVWARTLRTVEALAGRGPVLDIGCGAGQFLRFARRQGFHELEGVEPAADAAAKARTDAGARVHETDLFLAPVERDSFALVTAWDVLEHLPQPRSALRHIFRLLRPGGVLGLATPHRFGISVRAFSNKALVVMPPEHLMVASRRGLSTALAMEGFEVHSIESRDVRLREWLRFMPGSGVDQDQPRTSGPERADYVRGYERITRSAMFTALQAAANGFLRATRLGDQIVVLARKRSSR